MGGIKLQKRDHDFFVSYGHVDSALVAPVVDMLRRVCGLRVWFDGVKGNAAQRSSELLGSAIGNSRGALFCITASWKASSWCRNEYEVALSEQRANEGFEIISVRLAGVEPDEWFRVAEIIDLREGGPAPLARLLRSLASDVPRRFDNAEDVYLAAPWSRQSELTREALSVLHTTGLRLVGDSPNLEHLGEGRIQAIQATTRGTIALFSHDPGQPGIATSPYIVQEASMALDAGKPLLLLVEPGASPPADLVQGAFRGAATVLAPGAAGKAELRAVLDEFDDALQRAPHNDHRSFIFWAASLRGDPAMAEDIVTVIERASNMRCVRGERLSGDNVQAAIIERIRNAAMVIADVSDDHRNTLVEAGIAMGCRTQLKLICSEPPAGAPLKKRFMFEGQEFYWYRTHEERLGLVYYFSRLVRRRIYVKR